MCGVQKGLASLAERVVCNYGLILPSKFKQPKGFIKNGGCDAAVTIQAYH